MDRGYGMFVTLQFIVSGLGLYMLPVYADLLGASGLFVALFEAGYTAQFTYVERLAVTLALVGIFILIASEQFMTYLLATSMISFSWAFCLPFIQGLLASLDPHGSAVAATSASSTVGGAVGPGLAAVVVVSGSYDMVFLFAGALIGAALLSFYYSNRHASA